MPNCGSQVVLCGLPIRFDTYRGCSHGCKYCFVQRKSDLYAIETNETVKVLRSFINGSRTKETSWCDWNIPLHWGGLSDPFQPIEAQHRASFECLKVFVKTQYPFVVSTKGSLVAEEPYLMLLEKANCVVQISAVCSKYDVLEPGAPGFTKRLSMIETLSKRVQRVIVRIQPYMCEVFPDVKESIKQFAAAGAYGVIVEGMKFLKKKPGLEKVGGDYAYPIGRLQNHFAALRQIAHECGMKFYVGENRLRDMGDNLTCCGIDGLEGFTPNEFNICHILNGAKPKITEAMREPGTARCLAAINQDALNSKRLQNMSFKDGVLGLFAEKPGYYKKVFGK